MTHTRQRLGTRAEDAACRALEAAGAVVLERNARLRYSELGVAGELDAIALDGATLAFVEVKAGRVAALAGPEAPALAVGPRKQRRLRTLARAWLAANRPPRHRAIRFDVIAVTLERDRIVDVDWLKDAF